MRLGLAGVLASAAAGCSDPCVSVCGEAARAVGACIGEWSTDWGDLGANGQNQFTSQCEESWAQTAANLESRELEQAYSQCEELSDEIDSFTCEELRSIYAP